MTRFFRPMRALAVSVVLAALGGCAEEASYRVRFVSDPPGAEISMLRTGGGDPQTPVQVTGEVDLKFPADTVSYSVEAKPTGALETTHSPTTVELRRGDVHFLPETDGSRVFTVVLNARGYSDMPTYEAVYTPGRGLVALRTRWRAYEKIVEDDARAVEPVMPILDCDGVRGFAVSPRADRLAYTAFKVKAPPVLGPDAAGTGRQNPPIPADPFELQFAAIAQSQIRALVVRGTERQTITSGKYIDLDPSFSRDGEWLLYSGNHDRPALMDIYRQGAEGRTSVSVVTQDMGARSAFWPSESVGGLVAFTLIGPRALSLDDAEVCTRGGPVGYLSVVQNGVQPAISPDGRRIAYIKKGDLYVSDADGGQDFRLTTDADEITAAYRASLSGPADRDRFDRFERAWLFLAHGDPTWTPDGKWIVYTDMRNRDPEGRPQQEIVAVAAEGTREVRLTSNPSADRQPMVSGDGKAIYFLSNRGRQWAVWRKTLPPEVAGK